MQLLAPLQHTLDQLTREFDLIPEARKTVLRNLAIFINLTLERGKPVNLNFICTHNSRRSHLAQIWGQTAAAHYSIQNVECYSGGTEATAFNSRAVKAMREVGFEVVTTKEGSNPFYNVFYSKEARPILAFSKKYDDTFNPKQDFAAVMTCGHADENCPVVSGASKRFAITYDDPKEFDDTPKESAGYSERVNQIGREMLFVFSQV